MTENLIGRYEILSEIGRGGMAVVYLARDPNVNRQVAVKVLPRQFTFDTMFRERFKREAEVIAALEHPCIVPMYDFGEYDEQPFIVMRHMAGGSLVDRLNSGLLLLPDVERIIERVGSALDEAHQKHIIHRDLKPGNILFDQRGDAYLSDFGIVKMGEATASLTGSGIIGTPAYMSPEQAQGIKEIDGRSDIYSLGIILYEMLTGQPPYSADTPMRLVVKHILEPVPQLADLRSDLPPAYQAILERVLAKDPDARYQNGKTLSRDLHVAITSGVFDDPGTQVMSGSAARGPSAPTVAPPLGQQPTTRGGQPAAAKKPWVLWAGIGALILVAAGIGGLVLSGALGGGTSPTPTAESTAQPTATENLAEGLAATITAQAALLSAPTSTTRPTDTPTATVTSTKTPTPAEGTEYVPPTATRVVFTDTPAPTTAPPPTATPAVAGCPWTCPAGMAPGDCDASGLICAAAVGHCELSEECGIFCSPAWPGIQLNWYCRRGIDQQGNQTVGVCICSAKVP